MNVTLSPNPREPTAVISSGPRLSGVWVNHVKTALCLLRSLGFLGISVLA